MQKCQHDYIVRDAEGFQFYVSSVCVKCGEAINNNELRDFQSPDRLRARITELEAALRALVNDVTVNFPDSAEFLTRHAKALLDPFGKVGSLLPLNSTTKGD